MSGVLKISDAASLALHAMSYIALKGGERPISTGEISQTFGVSEAHLSKVFQRLSRQGLVKTLRGPGGGVTLAKSPKRITLLDIYEAIEGPLKPSNCLLGKRSCEYTECILGDMIVNINKEVKDKLSGTKLSELSDSLGVKGHAKEKADHRD